MIDEADFEWDPAKAAANLAKHGISFATATATFTDPAHVFLATIRKQDGEPRQKIVGKIENRIFTIIFVRRGDVFRLISARRANKKEENSYAQI